MFDSIFAVTEWIGIVVFASTGALVASRKQMDVLGFVMFGTITGIGGGTIRDVLLGIHPILWVARPEYLVVCMVVSLATFFLAPMIQSRLRLILWLDAAGLALFAATGAERALAADAAPIVAVTMGVIGACFGGILRDVLGQEESILFGQELYITAAILTAGAFVVLEAADAPRSLAVGIASLAGFALRAGSIRWGWTLPRYRPRPPRER
jgi:uncharacterized membrane protein YeiH